MPLRSPHHRPDLVTRTIAGETIIVPVRSGVGHLDYIYTLNETGTRLWRLIGEGANVAGLVAALREEFEVLPEEAERDVRDFLGSLEEAGLIGMDDARAGDR